MAQNPREESADSFEMMKNRLKNYPDIKSDLLNALFNQITKGDLEDGIHYDCRDNCMRIWKEKKGLSTAQVKKEYVEEANRLLDKYYSQHQSSRDVYPEMEKSKAAPDVSSTLVPPEAHSSEAVVVSSDLIPPPMTQSSTVANPVSQNVFDM